GAGYPPLSPFSIDYAFMRRPAGGCYGYGNCPTIALSQTTPGVATTALVDTDNNAADFFFIDTHGTSAGAGQRLGRPGPENLSSPVVRDGTPNLTSSRLDGCSGFDQPPNAFRDTATDPPNNSTFGTLDIRRTFTNNTGNIISRLRFRIVDVTTFPVAQGV